MALAAGSARPGPAAPAYVQFRARVHGIADGPVPMDSRMRSWPMTAPPNRTLGSQARPGSRPTIRTSPDTGRTVNTLYPLPGP